MLANDYSMPIQLSSTLRTMPLSKYYEAKNMRHFALAQNGYDEELSKDVPAINSVCDVEGRNCNLNAIAFCVATPVMQLNTVPPPPHNSYVTKYNVNVNKRNNHQNNANFEEQRPQWGVQHEDHNNGVGLRRNSYRFPYTSTFYNNNNYRCDKTSEFVCHSNNQNYNNNYGKNRYYGNHGKKPRKVKTHLHISGLVQRFTSRAKLFKTDLLSAKVNKMNQLDKAIWDLFCAKAQSEETYLHKLDLWAKLFLHITKLFERYGLFMVGSTMSGLATKNSDIDMCLLLRTGATDNRANAVYYLEIIRNSLINCDFVQAPEVILAKVPILKFRTSEHGFEVDLNCNNTVGIRNTHLLHCYTQLDWRVRPLIIIVKLWAQANGINDAKTMTISSYSYALMVIHFLQCGVVPPVIPCLHGLYPEKFNPDREIHDIDVQEELPRFVSDNKQSLGELLNGFLYYYANFNFDVHAISVRVAARVTVDECRYARSLKNDPHQWKYLCIEEPFDLTNTARSVYDLATFKRIQKVFEVSSSTLMKTEDLSRILVNVNDNQR
ncbi:hypothetical protein PPYR_04318 [Photinus pyralis]|uniref:Uncharacterized protein n=2 Tax=Photinus pyralis TaxID=7054 RepID=A0A1Y1K7Q4_PHOPY|nr:poly(A) RNA polymerase gld-2 homolog A-like [Photinus pyralis]KAB0802132.1 hypothetical protein PPYR_04318 [Photinus pyralis]